MARDARNPEVQALFGGLAVPHDLVTLRRFSGVTSGGNRTGGEFRVEPIPVYLPNRGDLKAALTLQVIDAAGSRQREERATAGTMLNCPE